MSNIKNPSQNVPDEVAAVSSKILAAELAARDRQAEIATLARPNEEERRIITGVHAQARGFNAEMQQKLRDVNTKKFNRVKEALSREAAIRRPFELGQWDSQPPRPEPTDPTFWWANTNSWLSEGVSDVFRDDGLHFFGGVTHHSGNLRKASFGAVALFGLQADRIPKSPSGRWLSTPHVELFGGLLGYTGNSDIFTGDLWSKCCMHRDQQLYQVGFSQEGGVPTIVGQNHEQETLIFEEDKDRSVHVDLRGFQLMPTVAINNINL
jgi:hypothetical protein